MPGQSLRSYGSRWSGPLNAVVGAGGTGTAHFGPVPDGRRWTIDSMMLSGSSPGGSCMTYAGDALPQNERGGSSTPASDTWAGELALESSEYLTIVWSEMTVGALATVNVHYSDDQIVLVSTDSTFVRFAK